MRGRLRAALTDRTALILLAASVVLALVLLYVPGLEPWRERAPLIVAWGAVSYAATAVLSLRVPPLRAPASALEPPPLPPSPEPLPAPPASLAATVTPVSNAGPPLPAGTGAALYPDGLTRREVEVLRLLASGQTNRQIARVLAVSVPTAERHIANMYVKIGAHGRADATAYAYRHGLVT